MNVAVLMTVTVTERVTVCEPLVTVTVYWVVAVGDTTGFAIFEVNPAGLDVHAYV